MSPDFGPVSPVYVHREEIKHLGHYDITTPPINNRDRTIQYVNRVPVVDVPAGTLLFRAIKLKDASEDNGRSFFTDMLGIPSDIFNPGGEPGFCLYPTQNMFAFPFPYIGFGVDDWTTKKPIWTKYNAFIVYVTTRTRPYVSMVLPTAGARGTPKGHDIIEHAAVRRCDKFGTPCFRDKEMIEKSLTYLGYDNCIHPTFMKKTGVVGTIALSAHDSFGNKRNDPSTTSLGKYIKLLKRGRETVDAASLILSQLYEDKDGLRGIPEIVSHIRKPDAAVLENMFRSAKTVKEAIGHLNYDMWGMSLNNLPIAALTSDRNFSIYDGGYMAADTHVLPGNGHGIGNEDDRRIKIENNITEFMRKGQTIGLGETFGKIMYDTRTGFYVCSNMAPSDYREDFLVSLEGYDNVRKVRMEIEDDTNRSFVFVRPTDRVEIRANSNSSRRAANSASSQAQPRWKQSGVKGGKYIINSSVPDTTRKTRSIVSKKDINTRSKTRKRMNKVHAAKQPIDTPIPIVLPTNPDVLPSATADALSEIFRSLKGVYKS